MALRCSRWSIPSLYRTNCCFCCTGQDLAVDAIEELWFTRAAPKSKAKPGAVQQNQVDADITQIARVIMAVTGMDSDRPPPVEEILRLVRIFLARPGCWN